MDQPEGLDSLSPELRATYSKLNAGLNAVEALLPAECSDEETRTLIGDVIARCKAAADLANAAFRWTVDPLNQQIKIQRAIWRPLADRALAIQKRATALVQTLIDAERRKREAEEAEARRLVSEHMAAQAAAEAKALSAESEADAAAAKAEADRAWAETRQAVQALDRAPAQTAVQIGDVTVYEAARLDFEIVDMAAFAKAHPELLEVRRGPTLALLRSALEGAVSLPSEVPGFPGVRLFLRKGTSARRGGRARR